MDKITPLPYAPQQRGHGGFAVSWGPWGGFQWGSDAYSLRIVVGFVCLTIFKHMEMDDYADWIEAFIYTHQSNVELLRRQIIVNQALRNENDGLRLGETVPGMRINEVH